MQKVLRVIFLFLIITVLGGNSFSATSQATKSANISIAPGQIVIKFKPQTGNAESSQAAQAVFSRINATEVEPVFKNLKHKLNPKKKSVDLSQIYQAKIPTSTDVVKLSAELSQLPSVEYAEPVYICRPNAIPNDEYYSRQYHLPLIAAEAAWDVAKGDSNVIIGIVDTGVDWEHPDLKDIIWTNEDEVIDGIDNDENGKIDDIRGWDFVRGQAGSAAPGEDGDIEDNNPMDFDGHGTHCSGLAAGVTNNEIGIASISWGCEVMALRIGYHDAEEDNGLGYSTWMAEAFTYATDNGASVVSLSFGNSGQVIQDAARYAHENGVVVVTSAGNGDSDETNGGLNDLPFVVKVAATDRNDVRSSYSQYGDWITVSAPGGNHSPGLWSTFFYPNREDPHAYANASGTSMASPLTAGLIGLVKSHFPEMTPAELIFQICETADNIDGQNPDYVGKLGAGRINAFRALTETIPQTEPKIQLLTYSVMDETSGNGNGVVDVGETVQISIRLQNTWGTAYNLKASLEINDWAVQVPKGEANFGTAYGIENIAEMAEISNDDDPFELIIDEHALPHRIEAAIVIQADGGYEKRFDFTMAIKPSILYVDDSEIDISSYYLDVLDQLGYSFEYYPRQIKETPANLKDYSTVIWGTEWTFPSLDGTDRFALASYLDEGGSLFISGQDLGWDLCDMDDTNEHEYTRSSGLSKTFYENYLHAEYLLDNSDYSSLEGVADDPIADGLKFNVFQPKRDSDNQYPDELKPINGAVSIFDFPNGSSGAVSYAGDYRVVNFGFGGFEAITDSATRAIVMKRVINWLNGLSIIHEPLKDTENITEDYLISATVKSNAKPVAKAELYWDTDGSLPLANKITMTAVDDSTFQAAIPAQDSAKITYTIYVENEAGFAASYELYSFRVGQDKIAPNVVNQKPVSHTLDKYGPYYCDLTISDNQEVDTSSVWLHYGLKGSSDVDSVKMTSNPNNSFKAEIPGIAAYGDTVVYYASAQDLAITPNRMTSELYEFIIGFTDFESPDLSAWEIVGDWGLDTTLANSGEFSISDSPGRNLGPEELSVLQLRSPLDLSDTEYAKLSFYSQYSFHRNQAYGYVEVSKDSGATWETLYDVTSLRRSWDFVEIMLTDYLGVANLMLRFRTESSADANDRFDGWYVDDIQLTTEFPVDVPEENAAGKAPRDFVLLQNYPNPFNPETRINYGLPTASYVELTVFNLLGQKVKVLINQKQTAGMHQIIWNGTNDAGQMMASGMYFYQLKADNFMQIRKMVLMK